MALAVMTDTQPGGFFLSAPAVRRRVGIANPKRFAKARLLLSSWLFRLGLHRTRPSFKTGRLRHV